MAATPSGRRFSSSALPLMAAATPIAASAARSAMQCDAAGGLPLQLRKARHGLRVQSRSSGRSARHHARCRCTAHGAGRIGERSSTSHRTAQWPRRQPRVRSVAAAGPSSARRRPGRFDRRRSATGSRAAASGRPRLRCRSPRARRRRQQRPRAMAVLRRPPPSCILMPACAASSSIIGRLPGCAVARAVEIHHVQPGRADAA